ncbi:biotin-dependent carboxyltransferase family protein [Formosa sp. Hel1_31_208]|uniref:5-oxoprolinase subunit C family protein n=1 Tax=Formosa sp. Hel1_31_208 TaxID=1798225 RepID=UPI0012FDD4C4|nr:biotin-dependent carboxyltransferase family protein [Formosa sp. Hel1_31_208]
MYDTIQDLGRYECQQYGVPYSGVMDRYSASLANTIVGNDANAAVIEITMYGPRLKFHSNTVICITGADMSPSLNSSSIKMNSIITVTAGDVLHFGTLIYGCRSYLSVFGGFQTKLVLASRSWYKQVTTSDILKKGDLVPITEKAADKTTAFATVKINKNHFETQFIDVYKGPEFGLLGHELQAQLEHLDLSISKDSNRMAYQFNERLPNMMTPIITSLVMPGSVQFTPSGQLIVLMRDSQTTGGYPRILQCSESAIDILAQKVFGEKIRFKCID